MLFIHPPDHIKRTLTKLCLSLLIASTILVTSYAAKSADNKKQISNLQSRITKLQQTLSQNQVRRQQATKRLAQTETNLGNLNKQLSRINTQLTQAKGSIRTLSRQLSNNQKKLSSQQEILTDQLKHLYALGRQPNLKLLLNPDKANTTSRLLTYYHYLQKALKTQLKALNTTRAQIHNNQYARQQQITRLLQLKQNLSQTHHTQLSMQKIRQKLINTLNENIQSNQAQIEQLLQNKKNLEHTIKRLKPQIPNNQHFKQLRGKLPWPINGKLQQRFNQIIDNSQLRTTGVVIRATLNQPVKAVASGRIIFARWLSGYGLLIIIDHGGGYLTLYGRNHSLLKQVGDDVKQGDIISLAGKSGGYAKPGLYFALRHRKQPLSPSKWCS